MIHPSEPVLSAAAAAVLLTFAAASAAAMTPGVYSAAVPARNGELAVEVQVSADRIESVKVVRQQETPGIGSLAVEALPAAIVAQQTSSVDVVSGATMTSNAIIKAVSEALKQAGADASFF
ncbi:FMN-binding protein, partial [Sutterella wadsworthensis]